MEEASAKVTAPNNATMLRAILKNAILFVNLAVNAVTLSARVVLRIVPWNVGGEQLVTSHVILPKPATTPVHWMGCAIQKLLIT